MQARVWGCRGSLAAPGADTIRYGGNTSCVEVRLDSGTTLVFDAGTGIRALGVAIDQRPGRRAPHHADAPAPRPSSRARVLPPVVPTRRRRASLGAGIAGAKPRGPDREVLVAAAVPGAVGGHPGQHHVPRRAREVGDDRLGDGSGRQGHSPGPTVGYRIEEDGRTLVYLPDHEPSLGGHLVDQPAEWISGHDVAHDADVLFHDAQYRDDEYPQHIGWGHSCIEHVMGFAGKAGAGSVVLFHHDPYHMDDELDVLLAEARRRWDGPDEQVCLACEGMTIDLDAAGVRFSA